MAISVKEIIGDVFKKAAIVARVYGASPLHQSIRLFLPPLGFKAFSLLNVFLV